MTNKLSGSMIREIKFKIHDRIYAASNRNTNGWSRELNYVSWGGRNAKYDFRVWSPEHDKAGHGITFSDEEAEELYKALGQHIEQRKILSNGQEV